jgi:hypothetical protein
MTSFTIQELCDMADNQPVMFFFFFFFVVMVLNSGFNTVGYSLQLAYCLLFEGGSYSSEQWRMFMVYPVLSNSLDDLWSHRWHQLLKSTWLAFPFRPVRILASRFFSKYMKNPSQIAFLCASLSVFVISGLMHEYIVAASIGWPVYSRHFMGEQQYFFTINGVGVLIEGLFKRFVAQKLPKSLKESIAGTLFGHLWVIIFGYFNFYYIMHGFISWGFQYDNPFVFTKPFILNFVRETPAVQPFFGSLIH